MSRVGRAAYALGFAGLLPPALIDVGLLVQRRGEGKWLWPLSSLAFLYAAVILSFLGGIWWGFAIRRDVGQGRLAMLSVLPSLVAAAIVIIADANFARSWGLVAIGVAIILTLPIDRHLVRTGEAPADWMRLRVPLSLGLGGLTIAAAVLYSGVWPPTLTS